MTCSLFDVGCHIQSAAWEWWTDVGLINKILIVGGVVGLIVALSWSFLMLLKTIGGWPAVVAAIAVIAGVVLALLPRKPSGVTGKPERSGKDLPFALPKRKRRKRVFDLETNTWKDV